MAPLVSRIQYPPVCWIGEDLNEDHPLLRLNATDQQPRFVIDHRRIKMHVPTDYHYRKYEYVEYPSGFLLEFCGS